MPKITPNEIDQVINKLAEAKTYAKEAHRLAMLIRNHDDEIAVNLKYSYAALEEARKILEGEGELV